METLNNNEITLNKLRKLYEQFGYTRFKMSKFEEYDLYLQYKKFLSTSNIITFTDLSGRLYALKPDITLSIAKSAKDGEVKKVYYNENVYRVSGSTKEYKELTQLGLEYIGEVDPYTLSEVLMLAVKSLSLISEDYVLDISHMGFITGLFEYVGLDESRQEKMLSFIGKKEAHAVSEYCDQLHLDSEKKEVLLCLCDTYGGFSETADNISRLIVNEKMQRSFDELNRIYQSLYVIGCGKKINLDFSIVNDLGYYNGVIFKGYVRNVPESILTGGRYDKLMEKLGTRLQAIGFAVSVDLLELYTQFENRSDVDALIVYDDSACPELVLKEATQFVNEGFRVKVSKLIPPKLQYTKLVKVSGEGVAYFDGND